MHRCVYLTIHTTITPANYISKTSLYTTFRMYPWGPWLLKILMFALLVTREIATYSWPWEKTRDGKYMLGLLLILISKSSPFLPPLGHAFPRQRHMRRGGGLLIFARFFFPVWCHPWMDGWKALTMTSFTICNVILTLMWQGVITLAFPMEPFELPILSFLGPALQ